MSDEKLAEALFDIFALKGYASTSITDLTQATGMKPASLYLAFGNKEGMYIAAMEHYRRTWLVDLQQILDDKTRSFAERISAFLYAAFTLFSHRDKPLGCMLIFSALAFCSDETPLSIQLRDERRAFVQWLEHEAAEAQAKGELADDFSPGALAQLILTLEQGLALTALDKPSPALIRSMLDGVTALLFKRTESAAVASTGKHSRSDENR